MASDDDYADRKWSVGIGRSLISSCYSFFYRICHHFQHPPNLSLAKGSPIPKCNHSTEVSHFANHGEDFGMPKGEDQRRK